MTDPTTTKALLVGIEKYDAGDHLNLNGPAHDVLRMVQWLLRQGIPAGNLTIFLSPLDSNLAIADQIRNLTGSTPTSATQSNIRDKLTTKLQQESASLFIFYWGGHGWVTQEGERRLFYADAQIKDERNLDFNDLLVSMRSDYYKKMSRHLFIIDTCANYMDHLKIKPPSDTLPKGKPSSSCEQFALFAAKLGDVAKNLDSERTGLYTKELLAEFESLPPNGNWLPEIEAISARLQSNFKGLRDKGLTEQTPTTLWNRDWIGTERSFGQMPISYAIKKNKVPSKMPELTSVNKAPSKMPEVTSVNITQSTKLTKLTKLRDALLEVPCFKEEHKRKNVLEELISEYPGISITSSDIITVAINLIKRCENYEGSFICLISIMEALYEGESISMKNLKKVFLEVSSPILPEELI